MNNKHLKPMLSIINKDIIKNKYVLMFISFVLLLGYFIFFYSMSRFIPLPGMYENMPISFDCRERNINNNLIPSVIEGIWWNNELIICKVKPKYKNKYEWYIMDLKKQEILHSYTYEDYLSLLKKYSLNEKQDINLVIWQEARHLREKELGFKLTRHNMYKYIDNDLKNRIQRYKEEDGNNPIHQPHPNGEKSK